MMIIFMMIMLIMVTRQDRSLPCKLLVQFQSMKNLEIELSRLIMIVALILMLTIVDHDDDFIKLMMMMTVMATSSKVSSVPPTGPGEAPRPKVRPGTGCKQKIT